MGSRGRKILEMVKKNASMQSYDMNISEVDAIQIINDASFIFDDILQPSLNDEVVAPVTLLETETSSDIIITELVNTGNILVGVDINYQGDNIGSSNTNVHVDQIETRPLYGIEEVSDRKTDHNEDYASDDVLPSDDSDRENFGREITGNEQEESNTDDPNRDESLCGIINTETRRKKRKKGENRRVINKKKRMEGKEYLGFRKPPGQRNTFHDTTRGPRYLKPRCQCGPEKNGARKCHLISDEYRKNLFEDFWAKMSWDQRKVYVRNTVTYKRSERQKTESRRKSTLVYTIVVKNQTFTVCKTMYLNTTGLGEWSVRNWVLQTDNGIIENNENSVTKRTVRRNKKDDCLFMKQFLNSLNKLPAHYCRKDTSKLYLEQDFQSLQQLFVEYQKQCQNQQKQCLSITRLSTMIKEMNIGLFRPRKDRCDECYKYENGNLQETDFRNHQEKKNRARKEKDDDKSKAISGKFIVITMDVEAVKLCPQVRASSLYYKVKLCCHNFTLYDLATHQATCYWFDETKSDCQANTYASCLVDYLKENYLDKNDRRSIIIFSDGCTAQNRNSITSNALLSLSEIYDVVIFQKFLVKGHTQMECDSVHATIETALKNKDIHLPSDYARITREARKKNPFVVKSPDFDFFLNYGTKSLMKYESIRPGKVSKDPVVTDIRALKYANGEIYYKLSFDEEFRRLPRRPKAINLKQTIFPPLHTRPLKITKKKYDHLQEIKLVIPKDCWSFYDSLDYE